MAYGSTWREKFRPLIADVIREHGTQDMTALRRALREAFPAGPRKYWPYRVWLDEIRVQLGLKKERQTGKARQRTAEKRKRAAEKRQELIELGQLELF